MEQLVTQARGLVKQGVKEIMLIAKDLTYYGLDIYGKRNVAELIRKLADVEGLDWIKLHYAFPSGFPMDIIDAMKDCPNVCNYLDMPLQHVSDNMLKLMRRGTTKEKSTKLVEAIREKVPGIAMRTTFLVGYPGETEDDFNQLVDWVQEMKFDRLGVFTYSHEENTHAYKAIDDVPAEVKKERAETLMDAQRDISRTLNKKKVGKTLKVLFDRKEGEYFIGRTEHDSPEVDNEVHVKAEGDTYVRIGDFADIKITSAEDYDLFGTPVK
jgi:ribosomal protein S12 methylthiotransferase